MRDPNAMRFAVAAGSAAIAIGGPVAVAAGGAALIYGASQVGNYTANHPSNPFVNGPLNPFGTPYPGVRPFPIPTTASKPYCQPATKAIPFYRSPSIPFIPPPPPSNGGGGSCEALFDGCLMSPWQPTWNTNDFGKKKDCLSCFRECKNNGGVWPKYKCPIT